MAKFNPPSKFSFKADDWKDWLAEFDRFRICSKLYKDPGEEQRDALLYCMGVKEATKIFNTFTFEGKYTVRGRDGSTAERDESETDYCCLTQKFTSYFIPTVVKRYERARFMERKQGENESFEEFLRDLYSLISTCQYDDSDDMLLDRIVQGLYDSQVRQKLELQEDLTLAKAIQIARQHELVKCQAKVTNVDRVSSASKPWRHRDQNPSQKSSQDSHTQARQKQRDRTYDRNFERRSTVCSRCGMTHKSHKCPASGKTCNFCKKTGHFIKVCRKRLKSKVDEVEREPELGNATEEDFAASNYWIGEARMCDDNCPPWEVILPINGTKVQFKIDTGADITILDKNTYQSLLHKPEIQRTSASLSSPGGIVRCSGEFMAHTTYRGHNYQFKVIVAEGGSNLLSRSAACSMGMVSRLESVQVFGSGGLMKTSPVKIHMDENAKPYAVNVARRIPFPIMEKVKAELQRLERHNVIRPVNEPSEWCAPIVPVVKKNGSIRITVDYKQLNKSVKRQQYMLPNLEDIAPKLAGAKVFSSLDAASGYYQIPLDEASARLTTFISPFGRYCFQRVPMGISAAPEIFQKKMAELLEGKENCEVIMDDILIHGKTMEEHDRCLNAVLETITASGLKLSKEKCQLRKEKLLYFGHIVGPEGIQANPEKVKAVQDMKIPTNKSELKTIAGMITYLGKFIPELSSRMKPMTDLLKESSEWSWGPPQQEAFDGIKNQLSSLPALAYYRSDRGTIVSADASSFGIGGALLQYDGDKIVPIAYCSRTLTESETKYAQIEKECLASVWVCEKFSKYLVGLPHFELQTDHKPLVPLMTTKDLDQCPIRCQRLLMRMMRFNPQVRYVPGKQLALADALSRFPLPHTQEDEKKVDEVIEFIESVEVSWPASPDCLQNIRSNTAKDSILQQVSTYITNGWPSEHSVPLPIKPFCLVKDELSVVNGLVTCGSRIVIPFAMQQDILNKIHETHQGRSKCREKARAAVWWPGIGRDIDAVVDACNFCAQYRTSNRHEPLRPTPLPNRPWEKVGVDLCERDKQMYLVLVDYYSRWIEIRKLYKTTTTAVVKVLKEIFSTHGIPDILMSDNGPQFVSEDFKRFCQEYCITQANSSPYMHQANGAVERAVQTAKRILTCDDTNLALLNYRTTPCASTGTSPAEALMSRQLRSKLPTLPHNLVPQTHKQSQIEKNDTAAKASYKFYYDRRHGARPLPQIEPGQSVLTKLETDKKMGTFW